MLKLMRLLLRVFRSVFRSRTDLILENVALRQQIAVLCRAKRRPRLLPEDRGFWVLLRRVWARWATALIIVKPGTVVRWHALIVSAACLSCKHGGTAASPALGRVSHLLAMEVSAEPRPRASAYQPRAPRTDPSYGPGQWLGCTENPWRTA